MLNLTSTARPLEYGGFWIRAAALLLDGLIILPLPGSMFWLLGSNPAHWVYISATSILFSLFYDVYLVQRFGGTPGKLIVGLQVAGLEGTAATIRQAFLREAPQLAFSVCVMVGGWIAAGHMRSVDAASFWAQAAQFAPLMPLWTRVIKALRSIWNLSELLVLLTNEKRRALHDFIAGTVVIKRSSIAPMDALLELNGSSGRLS